MATTTCPNCGKPLRPGAKFCGNCGATLPAASPRAAAPASPPAAESVACPHCGKPVRAGARFCTHCGKTIETGEHTQTGAAAVQADPAHPGPVGGGAQTARPAPAPAPGAAVNQTDPGSTFVARPKPQPAAAPPAARPRRGGLVIALMLALVIGCGLLAGGGYLVADRMGWIGALGQPTEAVLPTQTLSTTSVPATTSAVTPTLELTAVPVSSPTLEFTLTPAATSTSALPSPVGVTTSTVMVGAAPLLTVTVAVTDEGGLAPQLLFEDTFDTALSDNWRAWGDQRPIIDSGPGDRWLYLKAEDPGQAGVTTRKGLTVFNAPGTFIEFEGQLDSRYARSVMLMDWDTEKTVRGIDYREPGLVRLEIKGEQVVLQTPLTRERCETPVDAFEKHTYRVQFIQGQGVVLYLDGSPNAACTIPNLGLVPVPGAISFSGLGWVTRVQIMQGPLP